MLSRLRVPECESRSTAWMMSRPYRSRQVPFHLKIEYELSPLSAAMSESSATGWYRASVTERVKRATLCRRHDCLAMNVESEPVAPRETAASLYGIVFLRCREESMQWSVNAIVPSSTAARPVSSTWLFSPRGAQPSTSRERMVN